MTDKGGRFLIEIYLAGHGKRMEEDAIIASVLLEVHRLLPRVVEEAKEGMIEERRYGLREEQIEEKIYCL